MALAYLKYEGSFGGKHQFTFDVGQNQYYILGIGGETRKSRKARMAFIDKVYYKTPIQGVLKVHLGRGRLQIPNERLKDAAAYFQLISYADRQKNGPTFSDVVKVRKAFELNSDRDDAFMPELGFSNQQTMETPKIEYTELSKREQNYSDAMFWQFILSAIPSVIKAAAPLLKSIVTKVGSKVISNIGSSGAVSGIVSDVIGKTAGDSLKAVIGGSNGITVTATPPAAIVASPPNTSQKGVSDQIAAKITSPEFLAKLRQQLIQKPNGQVKTKAQSMGTHGNNGYSEAKIAPALVALLPMLKNVLSPDVMKAVIQSPEKLLSTVVDGAFKLTDRELKHLETINPGVDDPSVERILASMSLSLISNEKAMKFKRVDSVGIDYNLKTSPNGDKEVSTYIYGRDITFPITIQTPKPLPRTLVQMFIKDAEKLTVFAEKKFQFENIQPGQQLTELTFLADELKDVPANKDLLICTSVIFKNSKGQKLGAYKTDLFTLTEAYMFNHLKQSIGEAIPLNDVNVHRAFWHKLWQDDLEGETSTVKLNTMYLYQLVANKQNNGQNKTRLKFDKPEDFGKEREVVGKMRSGFEVSLQGLNTLMPQVSSHQSLTPQQLMALSDDHFMAGKAFTARTQLRFRGRAGDAIALWVFPEVKIHQISLNKTVSVDQNGQPEGFEEEIVHFPLPSDIHFVGVRTDS